MRLNILFYISLGIFFIAIVIIILLSLNKKKDIKLKYTEKYVIKNPNDINMNIKPSIKKNNNNIYIYHKNIDIIPTPFLNRLKQFCQNNNYNIYIYDDQKIDDFVYKYYSYDMVNKWKYINTKFFIGLLIIYQLGGYYFDINTNFIDYIKNNKNKTVIEKKVIISKNNNPELIVLMKKIQKYTLDYKELPNTIKSQKQFNITNEKIYPIHSSIEISRNQIKKNVEKKTLAILSYYEKSKSHHIDFIINYYKDYVDQVYLFIPFENWKNWVPTKNIEIKIFDIENSYVDSNMFHKIILTDNIDIDTSKIRNLKFTVPSYISFTTTPSRLKHPWMFNNIKNRLKIIDDSQLILNVPDKSLKNIKYEIPKNIKNLTSKKFYINKCGKDLGPITKIIPTIKLDTISDKSIIIICDDDIQYKEDVFKILKKSVLNHPHGISTMCNMAIEGFSCYAFVKEIMKDLLKLNLTKECERIDDDVISAFVSFKRIPIYENSYNGIDGFECCLKDSTDHPPWEELRNDDRNIKRKKCFPSFSYMFNKLNGPSEFEYTIEKSFHVVLNNQLSNQSRLDYYLGNLPKINNLAKYKQNTLENSKFNNLLEFKKNNNLEQKRKNDLVDIIENSLTKFQHKSFYINIEDRGIYNQGSRNIKIKHTHNPLSLCKNRYNTMDGVILPIDWVRHWEYVDNLIDNDIDWKNKQNKCVWRGVSTGHKNDPHGNRFILCKRWANIDNYLVDIGFSKIVQNGYGIPEICKKFLKNKLSVKDMLKFKYIISAPGNDKDSGLQWKLASNSIVLMPIPKTHSWLMENLLQPWVHYVPLNNDYEDLIDKIYWCEQNNDKCQQICKNASKWVYSIKDYINNKKLVKQIIRKYFEIIE
jgi:hypothetical protein